MKPKYFIFLMLVVFAIAIFFSSRQVLSRRNGAQIPAGVSSSVVIKKGASAPASLPKQGAANQAASTLVTANTCTTSTNSTVPYSVKMCFTSPSSGIVVSGDVTVSVSISIIGKGPGVDQVQFFSNGSQLITDFVSPYTFILPSTKWQDGTYNISAVAVMRDGYTTVIKANILLTFNNGITVSPGAQGSFTPTSGTTPAKGSPFVVVATGDGADGGKNNTDVTNEIASLKPNLFLYLGDVYQSGTISEFYNWYGTGSTSYSQFRSITDPTVGNHEYLDQSAAGYFSYWNNIPNYYSFNAGGWHFISLNANASQIGVNSTSPQYSWLKQDLSANVSLCTIVYYHQPYFNIGPEGSAKSMSDIWALMAQNGVSIVLNGHDHDYQRWVPLDANGNPDPTGISEFVAGTGGHGLQKITKSDSRVAYYDYQNPQAFGILELALTSNQANYKYIDTAGKVLDSGTISCTK